MKEVFQRLLGDNVFMATLAMMALPCLAVLFIGLNVLIRDGAYVPQELQYLEAIGGGGTVISSIYGVVHAYLAKKPSQPASTPPTGGPTNVQP